MACADPITDMARELAKRHPDAPIKTLARRLMHDGKQGRHSRSRIKPVVERPHRQAGVQYAMPPSKAEDWTPYVLDAVGIVGVLSDIHVPYHSEVALRAAVDHLMSGSVSPRSVTNPNAAGTHGCATQIRVVRRLSEG